MGSEYLLLVVMFFPNIPEIHLRTQEHVLHAHSKAGCLTMKKDVLANHKEARSATCYQKLK